MKKFTIEANMAPNIPVMVRERVEECGDICLQASRDKTGKYQYYSYSTVYDEVIAYALALKSIGVKKGDNVSFISDNRREWLIIDLAILSIGACDVPRGCDSLGKELSFIISYSDCKYGVFENYTQIKKIIDKKDECPLLKTVILIDHADDEGEKLIREAGYTLYYFDELLSKGFDIYNSDKKAGKEQIENDMDNVSGDDIATIIFTSGTTGTPKGVMLTHHNYMTMYSAIHDFLPAKKGDMWLTVLPVWHAFERLIQYVAPFLRCGLAYSKPIGQIMLKDMAEIKPQWMCGVPRLWEQLAKGVNQAMKKKGGVSYKLFNFFVKVGSFYVKQKAKVQGNIVQFKKRIRLFDFMAGIIPFILSWPLYKLGDILVFSKLRQKFGGNLQIAISGGGALQSETDNFYKAVGLNLLEGYGLTETCPVISFRHYKHPRQGVVGAIFPSFEVKVVKEENGVIVSDEPLPPGNKGLILVKGGQVMKGYYKRPDLTEKIIDKDGWLNTGDLGMLTYDNEIKITGRAKDTIVLLGGENIEPAVLEAELLTSDYIESCMVTGQDKRYLGCLIVPSKDAVIEYAQANNILFSDYGELLKTKQINVMFMDIITKHICVENGFRPCEKIFCTALVADSFKVGEELSAKQEMIRHKIAQKYNDVIEGMFN